MGQRSDRGQSAMHVYDPDSGIIFYSQVSLNGIGCWNTAKPLDEDNFHIIAQDNATMNYPSDINVKIYWLDVYFFVILLQLRQTNLCFSFLQMDSDRVIWFMTNKLPLYNYASIDPNDYNYRIYKAPAGELILNNSPCWCLHTTMPDVNTNTKFATKKNENWWRRKISSAVWKIKIVG